MTKGKQGKHLSDEALKFLKGFMQEYELEEECWSGATDKVGDELRELIDDEKNEKNT